MISSHIIFLSNFIMNPHFPHGADSSRSSANKIHTSVIERLRNSVKKAVDSVLGFRPRVWQVVSAASFAALGFLTGAAADQTSPSVQKVTNDTIRAVWMTTPTAFDTQMFVVKTNTDLQESLKKEVATRETMKKDMSEAEKNIAELTKLSASLATQNTWLKTQVSTLKKHMIKTKASPRVKTQKAVQMKKMIQVKELAKLKKTAETNQKKIDALLKKLLVLQGKKWVLKHEGVPSRIKTLSGYKNYIETQKRSLENLPELLRESKAKKAQVRQSQVVPEKKAEKPQPAAQTSVSPVPASVASVPAPVASEPNHPASAPVIGSFSGGRKERSVDEELSLVTGIGPIQKPIFGSQLFTPGMRWELLSGNLSDMAQWHNTKVLAPVISWNAVQMQTPMGTFNVPITPPVYQWWISPGNTHDRIRYTFESPKPGASESQMTETLKTSPTETNDAIVAMTEAPEVVANGNANTYAETIPERPIPETNPTQYNVSEDHSTIAPENITPEVLSQFLVQVNQTMEVTYQDTPFHDISLAMKEVTVKGISALRVFLRHRDSVAYFTLVPNIKSRNYTIISSESKMMAWAHKKMIGWAEKRTGWDAIKMRKLAEMATKKLPLKKKLNKVSDSGVRTI